MKKNTTAKTNRKALSKTEKNQIRKLATQQRLTIGLDLGDRNSRHCILDEAGEVVSEGQLLKEAATRGSGGSISARAWRPYSSAAALNTWASI